MLKTYDSYYDILVKKHNIAVIDTNLLLLYIVGSHNPILISERIIKRTAMFIIGEFFVIEYIINSMKSIVVSTSIWTEICNFAEQRPKNNKTKDYYQILVKKINAFKEEYFSCLDICNKNYLKEFDFTDSTIIELAKKGYLVVTADLDLANFLFKNSLKVINWNKIKDKIFTKYKKS